MFSSPLEVNLSQLIKSYDHKSRVLLNALNQCGFQTTLSPMGGYFIWVRGIQIYICWCSSRCFVYSMLVYSRFVDYT
jgi:DNA-binding transcriptional MocR family regulator